MRRGGLKRWAGGLLAAVFLGGLVAQAKANPEVYRQTLKSTTLVIGEPDKMWAGKGARYGTGALIDEKRRLVITNYHVVQEEKEVVVFFPALKAGRPVVDPAHYYQNAEALALTGAVVARDAKADLAVIQLPSLPEGVEALPMARDSVFPGQVLHSIGNSGHNWKALWRYIDGKARQIAHEEWAYTESHKVSALTLESSLPINPGDSGGPVVNDKGELVGVNTGWRNADRNVTMHIDITEVHTLLATVGTASTPPAGPKSEPKSQPSVRKDN